MRYFDLIETPKTGKTFLELEGGANKLPQNDSKVSIYFKKVDTERYERYFDEEGYPKIKERYLPIKLCIYADADNKTVLIIPDNIIVNKEGDGYNQKRIRQWELKPNKITDYDPDYGKTKAELKKEKRQVINENRDKEHKSLQVTLKLINDIYTFDAHKKARAEFNGAVLNMVVQALMKIHGEPFIAALKAQSLTWTTEDDKDVVINGLNLVEMGQMAISAYTKSHFKSRDAKKALNDSDKTNV